MVLALNHRGIENTEFSGFDFARAKRNLILTNLASLYEIALKEGKSPEAARQALDGYLEKYLPEEHQDMEFTGIRHQYNTSVVAHNKRTGQIDVSFDASVECLDWVTNANLFHHRYRAGQGHTGYYNAVTRPKYSPLTYLFKTAVEGTAPPNPRLIDVVRDQVRQYAAEHTEEVELTLSGFSAGAGKAAQAYKIWREEGFPNKTDTPNIRNMNMPYIWADPTSLTPEAITTIEADALKNDTPLFTIIDRERDWIENVRSIFGFSAFPAYHDIGTTIDLSSVPLSPEEEKRPAHDPRTYIKKLEIWARNMGFLPDPTIFRQPEPV